MQQLVTKKELKTIFGIPYHPQHIMRLEKKGEFPRRVDLGACRVAWVAEEVQAWVDERIKARDSVGEETKEDDKPPQ